MRREKYEKKTGRSGWRGALIAVIVFIAGLVLSPAFSRVIQAVDVNKSCSLTVLPGFDDEDVDKANIVIDYYKIAAVIADPKYDTYSFEVDENGPFKDVKSYLENMKELDSNRYQQVANTAAKAALDQEVTPDLTKPVKEKADMGAGLYLMIARGKDMTVDKYRTSSKDDPDTVVTIANSTIYQYSYLPQLVALPNTAETILPDQEIKTSDGEWKYDITATLKGEREKRFGWFKLTKDLTTYEKRQPATFVFSVDAIAADGSKAYSNVATIVFGPEDGAGIKTLVYAPTEATDEELDLKDNEVRVNANIPVDSIVTITEIYKGANYKITSDDTVTTDVVSLEDDPDVAKFTNDYTNTDKGGGSINNEFSYITVTDSSGSETNHWGLKSTNDEGKEEELVK